MHQLVGANDIQGTIINIENLDFAGILLYLSLRYQQQMLDAHLASPQMGVGIFKVEPPLQLAPCIIIWVLGKLGPGRLGPERFFAANWAPADWAPENLMVANWAPADWAPWRQIGPRQIGPRQIGPLENVGAANWAPGKLGP